MKEGTAHHEQHGARVAQAGIAQRAGVLVLLLVLVLIVVGITMVVLN